jgi:hypothetical protein
MHAKPIQFVGGCANCHSRTHDGALEVSVGDDADVHEWICLKCARKLAGKIIAAVAKCQEHLAAGLVFRDDRWQAPSALRVPPITAADDPTCGDCGEPCLPPFKCCEACGSEAVQVRPDGPRATATARASETP